MRKRTALQLSVAALCAALVSGCNTEWGVGFDPGPGTGNEKFPTLDGSKPKVFSQPSLSNFPANSLESLTEAINQNADFLAIDLVMSKDGVLVALGSPDITDLTDVKDIRSYGPRKATRLIDGVAKTGWFAADFTLAELQTLRLKTPKGDYASNSAGIQSFSQILNHIQRQNRSVGLYLQTRHPTFHTQLKLGMEDKLVSALQQAGYNKASDPVLIRSFEVTHLQALRKKTKLRLVQMIDASGVSPSGIVQNDVPHDRPYDFTASGTATTYKDMVTAEGLAQIKTYADGISPAKAYIVASKNLDKDNDGKLDDLNGDGTLDERDRVLTSNTALVTDAHANNLFVHPWVFSSDPSQLANDYNGSAVNEYRNFYKLGVDGVFSSAPNDAVKAR